jgi:cytidylate kinase
MSRRVVCISRTTAAGGEAIGQAVAAALGLRYVDEQIVLRAAELARVDPARIAAAEQQRPLLGRILDQLGAAQGLLGTAALGTLLPVGGGVAEKLARTRLEDEEARALIRGAIQEVGLLGNAVIVAHAASLALAAFDGVLRVLVTASAETRVSRVAESDGISVQAAAAFIAQSDRARRDYLRRFYGVDEELPTHYDLVVNTDALTLEESRDLIVFAARSRA